MVFDRNNVYIYHSTSTTNLLFMVFKILPLSAEMGEHIVCYPTSLYILYKIELFTINISHLPDDYVIFYWKSIYICDSIFSIIFKSDYERLSFKFVVYIEPRNLHIIKRKRAKLFGKYT